MIRMVTGGTADAKGQLKTRESGPFSLSPEAEARLVSLGVAAYVGEAPAQAAPEAVSEPEQVITPPAKKTPKKAAQTKSRAKKKDDAPVLSAEVAE